MTSPCCYFTSSTESLTHASGAAVTQYHGPHLPSLPPGCSVSRSRAPNAIEKALFKTTHFFSSGPPDDLFIFYPTFSAGDRDAAAAKIAAFKSTIESQATTVEATLKKEPEQSAKTSATSAESDTPTSTPYFGRSSIHSYKCKVELIPEEINAEINREVYLGRIAYYNIFRAIGAPHRGYPSGVIFYIDASKLAGSLPGSDEAKSASLKQLIGYLSSIHMVETRFNGKRAMTEIVSRNPKNVKEGFYADRSDWHVERFVELVVRQELKRRIDAGEWEFKNENGEKDSDAELTAWNALTSEYGVSFLQPDASEQIVPDDQNSKIPTLMDKLFTEKDAVTYQNHYKGDLVKERVDFMNCYGEWRNFVQFADFRCPGEDHPVVFAFDVAGVPEALAGHAGNASFEGEVKAIATLLHSSLKEPALSHFVRIDSSQGAKCPGIENLLRFSLDCMNRTRGIDEDEKKK